MIETYDSYKFEIIRGKKGWFYVIYDPVHWPCDISIIDESDESFGSRQVAYFAAVGKITLLQKEKQND